MFRDSQSISHEAPTPHTRRNMASQSPSSGSSHKHHSTPLTRRRTGGKANHSIPDNQTNINLPIVTPTDIHRTLAELVASPKVGLSNVWVSGELVNVSPKTRAGHMYFDLKDLNGSKLSCTLFSVDRVISKDLVPLLVNGTQLVVRGGIRCSCKYSGSQYQCNVKEVCITAPDEGANERQLKQWRDELTKQGLFEAKRKTPIPSYPQTVAIVTSDGSAAFQDVRQTLANSNAPFALRLYPCTVQGNACVPSVLKQLEIVCNEVRQWKHQQNKQTPSIKNTTIHPPPDLVLITRGGGSREDLWAFNHPDLVRGVDAMRSSGFLPPTVCAIGHQVDTPLLDSVCDNAYITPTYAAQTLVLPYTQIRQRTELRHERLCEGIQHAVQRLHQRYDHLLKTVRQFDIHAHLKQCLVQRHKQMQEVVCEQLSSHQQRLKTLREAIVSSTPWHALAHHPNIAIIKDENGTDDFDMSQFEKKTRGTLVLATRNGNRKLHYRMGTM